MTWLLLADLRLGFDDAHRRAWAAEQVRQAAPARVLLAGGTLPDDLVDPATVDAARAALLTWGCPVHLIPGGPDPAGEQAALDGLVGGPVQRLTEPTPLDGRTVVPLPVHAQEPWQPVTEAPQVDGPALAVGWGGPVGPDGQGPDRVVVLDRWTEPADRHLLLSGRPAGTPQGWLARWDGAAWQVTPCAAFTPATSPAPSTPPPPDAPADTLLREAHDALDGDVEAQRVLASALAREEAS